MDKDVFSTRKFETARFVIMKRVISSDNSNAWQSVGYTEHRKTAAKEAARWNRVAGIEAIVVNLK